MNNWFPMKKYDFISFVALIVLCVLSFIPFTWGSMYSGMDLFGWAQGFLMLAAPVMTLCFISLEKRKGGCDK